MTGDISYFVAEFVVVAIGIVLMIVAERRCWRPRLSVAISVALAFRATLFVFAALRGLQPPDFTGDFQAAGQAVLHGQDPLLTLRVHGWNYLPLLAYVFAAQLKLGALLGIPWVVAGRLVPVAADLALVVLVGRLAGRHGELRRFQYACCPLAVLVSAVHGQVEPIGLSLAVGGLLLARRDRPGAAGIALGLAIAAKSWPVLLAPAVLRGVRPRRALVRAIAGVAAVEMMLLASMVLCLRDTTVHRFAQAVRVMLGYRSIAGVWGWTGWWAAVIGTKDPPGLLAVWNGVGTALSAAVLLAALIYWRRADPVHLAAALPIAFLVVTAGFGVQYLLWPVPFLLARPTRFALTAVVTSSVWAAFGYLNLQTVLGPEYHTIFNVWVFLSAIVIVSLVAALPWRRMIADVSAGRDARPSLVAAVAGSSAPTTDTPHE